MTGKIYSTIVLALALLPLAAKAQQEQKVSFGPLHSPDSPREDWILPGDTMTIGGQRKIYTGKPMKNPDIPAAGNPADQERSPFDYGYGWGLHKGINLSVDLSAFATFGKNVPHRGGFAQTIDATYLVPVTKDNKLWMALGAYVNNVNYGGDSYRDGGVYGMLGYKINSHWDAYVYGQLSIANNYSSLYGRYPGHWGGWGYGMYPWGMGRGIMPCGYGMGVPGANVLGAGIRYTNTRKTFSLGINIEGVWYNNTPTYSRQYDYPVPPAPGK